MNDTQTNLINNNEYDIHFLLDMKKSLERQNSYIFALIDETNEYNIGYNQVLTVKPQNTFSLKLQDFQGSLSPLPGSFQGINFSSAGHVIVSQFNFC